MNKKDIIEICAWCDPTKEETNRLQEAEEIAAALCHHYKKKILTHTICSPCKEKQIEELRATFREQLDQVLDDNTVAHD